MFTVDVWAVVDGKLYRSLRRNFVSRADCVHTVSLARACRYQLLNDLMLKAAPIKDSEFNVYVSVSRTDKNKFRVNHHKLIFSFVGIACGCK